jgi:hypothetical protein
MYQSQGLEDYEFENPAYVVSLLYCLIVVPRELWARRPDDKVYCRIEEHCPVDLFDIRMEDPGGDKPPTYRLIRHLRNAVAHANFSVDSQMSFVFWDSDPRGSVRRTWEARIGSEALMRFLTEVGSILASEGLRVGS